MDPVDPTRNEETGGFSKRRISSILKAPRKSIICVDPEQEENVVEFPKPVEKRNSRRVSFAPANNVLLFSNEVKNTSPVRSPLQDLISTTTATHNTVQITEDGNQEIIGMETLLNAPLHTPHQKEKVKFHTEDVFGEKTVMFSTEDAFMDMTHCQTINIANNAELFTDMSLRSHDMMFNSDNGAMRATPKSTESVVLGSRPLPSNSDIRSISSMVPSLDPGFENFLASLFQSNGPPSKNAEVTTADTSLGTQKAEVDKENQVPPSVPAVMGGSLNASRKMDRSLYGSAMTKTVQAFPEDDCSLFPTKEFFPPFDPTSQLKQSSGAAAPLPTADKMKMNIHQRDAETLDRTIMFSAGDEFMDITQSHTVNIANGSLARRSQNQTMDNSSSQKEQQHDTCGLTGALVSGLDYGFKDFIAGLSKPKSEIRCDAEDDCRDKTVRFSADDAGMDITQSHTVNIATHDMWKESGCLKNAAMASAEDTFMDVTQSHTVNIMNDLGNNPQQTVDFLPGFGEKTVRFGPNAEDMDVTQSHTVNILTGFKTKTPEKTDSLPAFGEKTVRFGANEAAMDVTQSHTVNIVCGLDLQPQQHEQRACPDGKTVMFSACDAAVGETRSCTANVDVGFDLHPNRSADFTPKFGEKTVRFTEHDASMDVTRSHTVNIASDLRVHLHQNEDVLPPEGEKTFRFLDCDTAMDVAKGHTVERAGNLNFSSQHSRPCGASGEETVTFVADDAAMEETQSHTVNISTGLNLQSHPNLDCLPAFGERTVRFGATDAEMDVTRSHTVNIVNSDLGVHSQPEHLLPSHEKTKDAAMDVAQSHPVNVDVTSGMDADLPHRDSALLCSEENMEFPLSLSEKKDEMGPAPGLSDDAVDARGLPDQLGPQNVEKEAREKPVHQTVLDCPAVSLEVAATGAQTETDDLLSTDEPPQCDSVKSCETKSTCEDTSPKDVLDAGLTVDTEGCEPRKHKSPKSEDDGDTEPSCKSRRMSFADLHTKIRRLSHMISAAPDSVATESCAAPVPQQVEDVDRKDQDPLRPALGPELGPKEAGEGDQNDVEPTTTAAETPFKLKTQQLMSRLSVGGFKAKLPQRTSGRASEGERTKTLSVTNQLRAFDADVSDINDEELDSCEDVSEVLVNKSPHKAREKWSPPKDLNTDGPLEDNVFEDDLMSAAHGNGRLLPTDEDNTEDERRLRAEAGFNTGSQSCLGDGNTNITSAPSTVSQTTDESSSSHTASLRCAATFESTLKQSLLEYQLDDHASLMQKKFDDGSITVLEFFKLFNIDFVIHNPRQSILPERLLSDTERTPLESLKDRHIHHPRHKVYEADVLSLTQKVEGLKERMHDLHKPLRIVNKTLWEEMSCYTENELKSFGAKLKQRNNFFRKSGKVQSHQMKEALYSDLVRANQAEQQSLRETIEKADEMITTLDGCICELEAELAQVVEKGSGDSPSLKSLQHEINKVNEALTDDERQISELEVQIGQNSKKLNRLKAEMENLEDHATALNMVSEWRSGDSSDSHAVFTFLYNTFHLQLIYENPNGKVADNEVKKISSIEFKHHIDEEKSHDHAHIVHKLLSQYLQGRADWVQNYPTARHVPKLLLDVSLVVGHCRLLGEELRLLKMWGGLRLDILSISCVDTLVHIVFSSLKKMAKFEVIFSVTLRDYHYVLHLHSFKNMIGDTTLQQVEDIVTSLMPGKNLLTKTVKKMFEDLLR